MTDAPKFTREELNRHREKAWDEGPQVEFELATFALTLLDELDEAEEAIRKYRQAIDHIGSSVYSWETVLDELRSDPAVRRALERKKP